MRITWIAIAVFLLDQLSKFALQFTQVDKSLTLVDRVLSLVVKTHSGITSKQLNQVLLDSNSWIVIVALITIPLLISRWNALFHFITLRALLGLQLTAGAGISYAFDYLLRGTPQSTIELRLLDAFTLKAGIADLALISGLILLIYVLLIGATRLNSRLPLREATPAQLNFSPLPRGVDNIHVDVELSPELCKSLHNGIQQLVTAYLDSVQKRRPFPTISGSHFSSMARNFSRLHHDALNRAKATGEPQQLDLLYIALLKQIHSDVDNCVSNHIHQVKEAVQEHHQRGLSGGADSRHVEEMFRQKERIIARINQQMFDAIVLGQLPALSKGVKGFLGNARSFAMDAVRSPMVTANDADTGSMQFRHYLLFGVGKYSAMDFMGMDRVLDEQLRDYLMLVERSEESLSRDNRREFDNNSNFAATLSRPSVLGHPHNVTTLFDQNWCRNKLSQLGILSDWGKYHIYRTQLRFQQRLAEKLIDALTKAGFSRWIIAVYETRSLLNRANPELPPWNLTNLLLESKTGRELQQRLQQPGFGAVTQELKEGLLQSWNAIQKTPDKLLCKHLYDFIFDFANYRRDLQLLYKFHSAANEVSLLQDKKSIQTSRSNYTLYDFLLPHEKQKENARIRSHIIIKADLRGSTEITDRLNQLALNPATHFDRNFFSPINEVVNGFGAEKVFIEGDAIILILNDFTGTRESHLIASRACGLAAGILEVVAKQNRELKAYGLPLLELGIGIAYSNESPRFLFDGDHKITISPAINRADRLSACAWSVRNWRERIKAPETHVEVYQPSERALGHGEKAQKDLVYNLNGILIEPEVFELLQKEMSLKRIINKLPQMQESRLFAIKVTNSDGNSSSLLIRRAPIKVFDPEYTLDECPVAEGRVFYEVIHDEKIINSLRARPNKSTA